MLKSDEKVLLSVLAVPNQWCKDHFKGMDTPKCKSFFLAAIKPDWLFNFSSGQSSSEFKDARNIKHSSSITPWCKLVWMHFAFSRKKQLQSGSRWESQEYRNIQFFRVEEGCYFTLLYAPLHSSYQKANSAVNNFISLLAFFSLPGLAIQSKIDSAEPLIHVDDVLEWYRYLSKPLHFLTSTHFLKAHKIFPPLRDICWKHAYLHYF